MHYQYAASYAMEESMIALLSGLFSGIPSFLIGIAVYVFTALALYTIAKRRCISKPWLSWVPVVNVWVLGSLSDQYRYVVRGENKSKRKALLVLSIIGNTLALAFLSMVIWLVVRIIMVATAGQNVENMVAPLVRSAVLLVADQDYIEAAGSYGSKDARILLKYIIPNALGPIIVNTTMNIAGTILAAAGLSFIGMGIQPPTPEWGAMLSGAREYMRQAPYLMVYPGLAILLSVLSLNLIGDGLRDALDPKLKK